MMKTIFKDSQKRGSALLIVLGFLTFLIISSVSFAIYMRIERQASSNYKHAVTARHMLNSALYRAMDEIDSELRISTIKGTAQPLKFPDWPGRTRPSAVPNGLDNGEEARVLSMEALGYIPAIFVNDVRRYAVTNVEDGVIVPNGKYSFLGAKWRPLSMPVTSLAGLGKEVNAYEESVIGRYAYLCVNLSDMLDVNVCRAAVRNAETNRVSIGHLFATEEDRITFDDNFRTKDFCYQTLQDFYACMYKRYLIGINNHFFCDHPSPFHEWIDHGNDDAFKTAGKHILVAGGMAKPEPTKSTVTAINIADKSYQGQANVAAAAEAFATQLAGAGASSDPFATGAKEQFQCMLMDYLDEDNAPYWQSGLGVASGLYRPTVEMVPMVYQIIIPATDAAFLTPAVVPGTTVGTGAAAITPYNLKLTASTQVHIIIENLFPFKHWDARKAKKSSAFSFTLETRAYLVVVKLDKNAASGNLTTQNATLKALAAPFSFQLTSLGGVNDPMPSSENKMVKSAPQAFTIPDCEIELFKKDANGMVIWGSNGFQAGDKIKIALVVFAGIKNSDGIFVDTVPGYWDPGNGMLTDLGSAIADPAKGIVERLFFETQNTYTLSDPMPALNGTLSWTSLSVPDARYNHKASNWVWGTLTAEEPNVNVKGSSVTQDLLGQAGRDGDVYQFVANQGRLFSPGEFGFLPRPIANAINQGTDKELAQNTTALQTEDAAAMFRTVRLYDHTSSYLRDNVYDYFKAENADGTAIGARVNPLSDLSLVLAAAIERTPVDYWYAALDPVSDATLIQDNNFNTILGASDWTKVTNAWSQCLINAKKTTNINTALNVGISDVYGSFDAFGWYSSLAQTQNTIFNPQTPPGAANGIPVTLSAPLSEIDRKMLYSFSLDSFSDRQQLFLYILRAEATVPSLGGKTKSVAGGHAVALVWRDPYPVGYKKSDNTWLNKGSKTWYQQKMNTTLNRISPWYQVNNNNYDEQCEAYDPDSTAPRLDGYHEQKILFFKLLED